MTNINIDIHIYEDDTVQGSIYVDGKPIEVAQHHYPDFAKGKIKDIILRLLTIHSKLIEEIRNE